jgi:hypothetical protein
MLMLRPVPPPDARQFSAMPQPFSIFSMRFVPTSLPCGLCTTQSPTQKSNWRYSGAVHGAVDDWSHAAMRRISIGRRYPRPIDQGYHVLALVPNR